MNNLIYNVHKTQEYFLRALSKEIFEEQGITAFSVGNMDPNLNWSLQTGNFEDDIETTIHGVETFYQHHNLSWRWMMNPAIAQEDLKNALRKRGYGLAFMAPVLVGSLEAPSPVNLLQDVDIQEVKEEKLSDWLLPLKKAFQAT